MDTKFVKVKCKKTNKYFALEVVSKNCIYEVVNFVDLTADDAEHISTEISASSFVAAKNLIPCRRCGSRKFASCNCNKQRKICRVTDKYDYQCFFCNELEVDYSRSARGPYTEWAGVSNIPAAAKDRFGNPQGGQYDLAQDGSFKGYTIIVLNLCGYCSFEMPRMALEKKGFKIIEHKNVPSEQELQRLTMLPNSQLWLVSDDSMHLSDSHIQIIKSYFIQGHGIYIWGDNQPFYVDANRLLNAIFSTKMSGDLPGDNVISIQTCINNPGIIANHPITTGIVNFYEGRTIATIDIGQILKPLVFGSARNIVTAYYDANGQRALVDGGFTRLYHKWDSAGTDRYVVNAAAWLANIERFGYNPQ